MALDPQYIVASDLEQYFVDKDSGLPLAGGTITFFRDVARSTPKTVYQLSGSPPNYTYTALPNPITLSSVGTVQDAGGNNVVVYYKPYYTDPVTGIETLDLYYVEVESSGGVAQFTREAWPNVTSTSTPGSTGITVSNQLSNPQFTEVYLNETGATTFTVSAATNQEFALAPDWTLVVSGTGTVDVTRVLIAGSDNVITSPPYALDITVSAGVTACYIRQRFPNNSGLWASTSNQDIYLSGAFVAKNQGLGTVNIQMFYEESTGGTPVTIMNESVGTSYAQFQTATPSIIPLSTNTDTGVDAYIDIYLSFPAASHVRISSIQVVPASESITFSYDLESANRETALLGDYFLPRLNARPQASLLVGWDFPLNPSQFGSGAGNIGATGAYIWDQTIAARGASAIAYARSSITGGIQFTTAGTNDAFYIMQYLSGKEAKKILGSKLSVNINGYRGSAGGAVTGRVYLYRGSSAATFPTLGTTIGTLASSGVFTLTAANWTLIPRTGLDTATFALNTVSSNPDINLDNDYGFSQWEVVDATEINDTDKFAIVVTFSYAAASTVVTINSISVCLGDIPSRPATKTFEETLNECRYYYETTFNNGTTVPTATFTGITTRLQSYTDSGGTQSMFPRTFAVDFKQPKVAAPTNFTTYSGSSTTAGNVECYLLRTIGNSQAEAILSTYWSVLTTSQNNIVYRANSSSAAHTAPSAGTLYDGFIGFHYVADSRLGV